MIRKEYVRPEIEEIELILESSFLEGGTGTEVDPTNPDVPIDPEEGDDF